MEQQNKKMSIGKKILIGIGVIFALAFIGSLFSDDENANSTELTDTQKTSETNKTSESNEKSSFSKDNTKKIGDQIEVGNFSYVVNEVKFSKSVGNEFAQETADGIFLIIKLKFRNNDNKEHILDNSIFKLTDKNGTEYESSNDGSAALEMSGIETLFLKQCNPKIEKSGFLIFEVPTQDVYDLHLSDGAWSGNTTKVRLVK